jgi:hypothetical protein
MVTSSEARRRAAKDLRCSEQALFVSLDHGPYSSLERRGIGDIPGSATDSAIVHDALRMAALPICAGAHTIGAFPIEFHDQRS